MTEFDSPPERDAWNFVFLNSHDFGFTMRMHKVVCGFELDYALERRGTRVAVEIDGKEFHDPVRDRIRDRILKQAGWWTYRIPAVGVMYSEAKVREDFRNYLKNVKMITWEERQVKGFIPAALVGRTPWGF